MPGNAAAPAMGNTRWKPLALCYQKCGLACPMGYGKGMHPLGRGFAACPRGSPSGRIEHVVKKAYTPPVLRYLCRIMGDGNLGKMFRLRIDL